MNDFTQEELEKMYDKKTVKYILANNIRSFKKYCTCGGYAQSVIRHKAYCPQEQEVIMNELAFRVLRAKEEHGDAGIVVVS